MKKFTTFLLATIMLFSIIGLSGCKRIRTAVELVRPNIGRVTGTLTANEAQAVIDDWSVFVASENLGAFELMSEMILEIPYGEETAYDTSITALTGKFLTDGVNWYFCEIGDIHKGEDEISSWEHKDWFYDGTNYSHRRSTGSISSDERFVVIGESYNILIIPRFSYSENHYTATRHRNFTRFLVEKEEEEVDIGGVIVIHTIIAEYIFDNNNRLIYASIEDLTISESYFYSDMKANISTIIKWGRTNVPAPTNPHLFLRPPTEGIRVEIRERWTSNTEIFVAHVMYGWDFGSVIIDSTYTHPSWYRIFAEADNDEVVRIVGGSRIEFIGDGTVTLTIRSVVAPSVYATVTLTVR